MSEQQAYDRLLPIILNLPKEMIKHPHMPVEEKIMEGHKLLKLATEDKDVLLASGINLEFIDTLEDRIGTYSIANANYIVLKDSNSGIKEEFHQLEEKAHNLKRKLLHDLNFALEDREDAQGALHEIAEGRSRNDLIYDFVPLKKLIETFPNELEKIHFDYSLVEQADSLHISMQDIFSQMKASPKGISEVKDIRDRAYTYLEEALTKIKKHGQYVFWEDEIHLSLYKSEFMSNIGQKKGNSKKEFSEEENATIQEEVVIQN